MKNLPDKIYLATIEEKKQNLDNTFVGIAHRDPEDIIEPIEYVRTDAFIEKACKWLKENKDKYLYNTGERWEYIPTCSDKMIDDFRKYMEGE